MFPFVNNVLIETRDTKSKSVWFHCFNLETKEYHFTDLQFEEKFWIGIETAKDDFIIFHKYQKPDMPMHKGIFFFDIKTQKIIWQNEEFIFYFAHENFIYTVNQTFDGKKFCKLDLFTGNIIEEYSESEYEKINELKSSAANENDFSDYHFSKQNSLKNILQKVGVEKYFKSIAVDDFVETIEYENIFFVGYHSGNSAKGFSLSLAAFDESGKLCFHETIDKNLSKIAVDTFFILKNKLFILKEKKFLQIFSIT